MSTDLETVVHECPAGCACELRACKEPSTGRQWAALIRNKDCIVHARSISARSLSQSVFRSNVQFEFSVGDAVLIKGSSIEATVVQVLFDGGQTQFNIVYWYNGARNSVWVYAREILLKP